MAAILMHFAANDADQPAVLAAGLRRRDPCLLDALIRRYEYRLFRYLLYLTGNRETAEDLFQETWVRVLDRGHSYNGRDNFDTWLFAIARNLVIDLQRRRKPQPLDSLEEPRLVADEPSPLEEAALRQQQERIQVSMENLPAPYREVLLLRFQEDLPLNEIAAITGAPLPTVKSRLYRAIDALRRGFQEDRHGA